ncbi:MAG TPA: hypothetical protein ENL03_04250, partial [Phycisphaerae bacterium]|nr:hypothetical protein [Phycisphaerae bacterium]
MWRVFIGLLIGGGVMVYFGYTGYRVSQGTSSEPALIELADLEKNMAANAGDLDNPYIRIGKHWGEFPLGIYEWEGRENEQVSAVSKVNHFYYPLTSYNHPYNKEWEKVNAKYGDKKIPDSEVPRLKYFAVLVKTEQYSTVGAIPNEPRERATLDGLVINRIDSLDGDEKALIRSDFPNIDFDKVLILEEGRKPQSVTLSLVLMLGGIGLIIGRVVLGLKIKARGSNKAARPIPQPAIAPT